MWLRRRSHQREQAVPETAAASNYAPTFLVYIGRRSLMGPPEAGAVAALKACATREARALGYRQPYGLVVWQQPDGRWSALVPWSSGLESSDD